jgi:signal transduction histidine kinase
VRRRTLGGQLTWLVVLATLLGMLAFSAVAAFVIWLDERSDGAPKAARAEDAADAPRKPAKLKKPKGDDALEEIAEDIGLAVVVATPLGLIVALLAARWAARRATRRIDGLIATAARMSAHDPRARLPLSDRRDELDDLAAALNQVFDRMDEGIAALRRFAGDASHELRTPLAVLISGLEVARRRPREAAEWEAVGDRTLDEARRMADLVEALLQGARVGAFDLVADPVEVDAELDAVAARCRAEAEAAGVALTVDAASGAAVRIDPRGLAIVLGNLVGNALRHSPRGGAVALRARALDGRVRLEVDDQGPGVPAAERERLLARPGEADGDARKRVGLGLSIARRIALAHGGTLTIEDAPGGGARFAIELPTAS